MPIILTKSELEKAARQFCLLREIDPDKESRGDTLTTKCHFAPNWTWAVAKIKEANLIEASLAEARFGGVSINDPA